PHGRCRSRRCAAVLAEIGVLQPGELGDGTQHLARLEASSVQEARHGGRMTFEEFAQTRLPELLAFATVLTGQRATAEDITQEVLIRAHGRWDQIARLDRPELYVRKMLLNEFLSWRRRSWRTVPAANPVPA